MDPVVMRLRLLRAIAEDEGDDVRADALTVALRAHLAELRAATPAADVIDLEAARKRRGQP